MACAMVDDDVGENNAGRVLSLIRSGPTTGWCSGGDLGWRCGNKKAGAKAET